jgi:hypothetical protein
VFLRDEPQRRQFILAEIAEEGDGFEGDHK